jgi:hypothetical protein
MKSLDYKNSKEKQVGSYDLNKLNQRHKIPVSLDEHQLKTNKMMVSKKYDLLRNYD